MSRRTLQVNLVCAGALLALLGLAALVWSLDLGAAGTAIGLGLAAAKALLIAVVFMELGASAALTRLFALAGLYWLAILIALTLTDFLTR